MTTNAHPTSIIHSLDPRVKIAWSVVVSLLAVLLRSPPLLAALLAVGIAPWCLVGQRKIRWRWLVPLVATTVLGSMLSQGLFYAAGTRTEIFLLLPGVSICKEGIAYGAVVSLRLLAVVSAGALVVFTTRPAELIAAMNALRVPQPLAVTLTSALRLLPEIAVRGKRILALHQPPGQGRGGLLPAFRRFRRSLVPLFAISLRSARKAAHHNAALGSESKSQHPLRFKATDWATLAGLSLLAACGISAALLGYDVPSGNDPATTCWPYLGAALGLVAICGVAFSLSRRGRRWRPFTPHELATAAVLICLLRIAVIPWQIGLAKLPGLNALIFAIPYTAIFLTGLQLAPRPGFAALLIIGQGAFGQLLGSGINPAWWPYYLFCAAGVEAFLFLTGYRVQHLSVLLATAMLRGLLAGSYSYLIAAPFIWHKFYAGWYIALMISMDLVGCALGAAIAWRLAPTRKSGESTHAPTPPSTTPGASPSALRSSGRTRTDPPPATPAA